jgi:hypothetical protein
MSDGESVRGGESVSVDIQELTDSVQGSCSDSMAEQRGECRLKTASGVLTAVPRDSYVNI